VHDQATAAAALPALIVAQRVWDMTSKRYGFIYLPSPGSNTDPAMMMSLATLLG